MSFRINITKLKNFLRYMERENIKWTEFRFLPNDLWIHTIKVLTKDYNKHIDNEEDKVNDTLVAFALSADIEITDNEVIRKTCSFDL